MSNYMAIDQHGNTEHNLGKHPRMELLCRLGKKSAQKMYRDNRVTGETYHAGYVIGKQWFELFEVVNMAQASRTKSANALLTEVAKWFDKYGTDDSINGAEAVDFIADLAVRAKECLGMKSA